MPNTLVPVTIGRVVTFRGPAAEAGVVIVEVATVMMMRTMMNQRERILDGMIARRRQHQEEGKSMEVCYEGCVSASVVGDLRRPFMASVLDDFGWSC
jgi:hypothetical protein